MKYNYIYVCNFIYHLNKLVMKKTTKKTPLKLTNSNWHKIVYFNQNVLHCPHLRLYTIESWLVIFQIEWLSLFEFVYLYSVIINVYNRYTDVRRVPFWCFSFNVGMLCLKYSMITRTSVALWLSIGLHKERFSVRPPDSPKYFVVFIQYYYRKKY